MSPLQFAVFQEILSWETKLGSMVIILRTSFRVITGNHPIFLVWKNFINQNSTSRWCLLWIFFNFDGVVWAEFVSKNTTLESEYNIGLVDHLRSNMHRKCPEKWTGSPSMTMLHVTRCFLYKLCHMKALWCVLIYLIHWMCHRETPGSSPNSKWPWKIHVLNLHRAQKQPTVPQQEREGYHNLVDRSQGSCQIPPTHGTVPMTKNCQIQNFSKVNVQKSHFRMVFVSFDLASMESTLVYQACFYV